MTDSKLRRGFSAMNAETQRDIASKGGKAAHAQGTAHEFDTAEATEAGRKGGLKISEQRDHMSRIGRLGGLKRAEKARAAVATEPTP